MSDDRQLPQDTDAEKHLLGALMLSKDAIADVIPLVDGPDFYLPVHERIFEAILFLFGTGDPVDAITVNAHLGKDADTIRRMGGGAYLHDMLAMSPVPSTAAWYAQRVRALATKRRMIGAGQRIQQIGYSGDDDTSGLLAEAEAALDGARPGEQSSDYRVAGDLLVETIDAIEAAAQTGEVQGVPTGFYDLDELLGGLHPGQMVIVAGRPAMGKSTLAVDFARAASIVHRLTTVVFSLEMSRQEIMTRVISAEAKVALNALRAGHLSEGDWQRIATVSDKIAEAPLWLDDSANLTMTEIRAKARRLHHEHGLRLIVVDYLQLMTSGRQVESRQLEVSEFSRQMKLLAKELGVPVVALSQLNRGPEQRTNKRPMLSDLRESGSLEQDADVVILVHREDMYDKESDRLGEADLIIAKHRNGATRDVVVAFQGHYSRFVDMAKM